MMSTFTNIVDRMTAQELEYHLEWIETTPSLSPVAKIKHRAYAEERRKKCRVVVTPPR